MNSKFYINFNESKVKQNEDGSKYFVIDLEDSADIAMQMLAKWKLSNSKMTFNKWLCEIYKQAVQRRLKEEYEKEYK